MYVPNYQTKGWDRLSIGNGRVWAICQSDSWFSEGWTIDVVCVGVDSKGVALDKNIYRIDYRQAVADENLRRHSWTSY
jgi:hypothetical protein